MSCNPTSPGRDSECMAKRRSVSAPATSLASGLLILLAQKFAGLWINEVKPGADRTDYPFIFGLGCVFIIVGPMLDIEAGRRAPENERGHVPVRMPRTRPQTLPDLLLTGPGSDRQAASRPSTMELVDGNAGMQWKLTRPYSPALWPDMNTFGSFGIRI